MCCGGGCGRVVVVFGRAGRITRTVKARFGKFFWSGPAPFFAVEVLESFGFKFFADTIIVAAAAAAAAAATVFPSADFVRFTCCTIPSVSNATPASRFGEEEREGEPEFRDWLLFPADIRSPDEKSEGEENLLCSPVCLVWQPAGCNCVAVGKDALASSVSSCCGGCTLWYTM